MGVDLGVQAVIVRSLRIGRVLRIVKRAKKLQIIFQTLVDSLPSMASLGVLLILGTGNVLFAGLAYWAYKKYSAQQAALAEQRAAAAPNA